MLPPRLLPVLWVGVTVVGLLVRVPFLDHVTLDFTRYTAWWWVALDRDGAAVITGEVAKYNYSPPYLYVLTLFHPLTHDLAPAVAVKVPSIVCDVLCAWAVSRVVGTLRPEPRWRLVAYAAVLLAPTVVLNSSAWGQVDSLYTAALCACVHAVLTRRDRATWIWFGLALAFKLQSVFLLPALAALLLRGRLSWRWVWLGPATVVAMMVPAALAGRPVGELLGVYSGQAGFYRDLAQGAPNLWSFAPDSLYDPLLPVALVLAAAVLGAAVLAVWRRTGPAEVPLRDDWVLLLCTTSVVLAPFVLPKMHDRYFFPADVLLIALACAVPRYLPPAVAMSALSLLAYLPYLYRTTSVPAGVLGIGTLVVLVVLLRDLVRHRPDGPQPRLDRDLVEA